LQKRLLKSCIWTKRIEVDGKLIPIDEFLTRNLHLKLTPGTSVQRGHADDGK